MANPDKQAEYSQSVPVRELTVTTDDWWFNVRPSNTEPLLRLNVEAADETTMRRIRDDVLRIVRGDR